jgi:hypothetical protein
MSQNRQVGLCSAVFSPTDPKTSYLVASTQDWDIEGYQVWYTNGSDATFSSDGTHFISHSGTVATVQNSNSGAMWLNVKYTSDVIHLLFLPLPQCSGLAAAAADLDISFGTSLAWTLSSLKPSLHIPETSPPSHSSHPLPLSQHLEDQSVKFWQIGKPTNPATGDSQSILSHSAPVQSVNLQAEKWYCYL